MTETLGFLLLIFICLYFDKREENKQLKKENNAIKQWFVNRGGISEYIEARDSAEEQ